MISKTELFLISIIVVLVCYIIYNKIYEYYNSKDEKLLEVKEIICKVFPEFKNIKTYKSKTTSFTINKNKIYMCLKNEKNEYYDNNTLIYVLLHEYSHTLCPNIGHTDEFHKIFDDVLILAEKGGIYDSSKPITEKYCEHIKE